ncbi:NAD(P)H-binding protein [Kitasatospora purpeofusca]|uniref:NAD(P)H-binding protein n=1 Tax=Kitasatospora purpeofusca TaxID=67352 RepID=UPI002259F22F|nr:NAD(P)H-binding protein [Kitasatospora purpeofusca]MCX4758481.1 NAD(P)H-binding protein [Kitasatospora purpeofusca]WSR31073.1 NAD(P)H-binding protein [Kitasatospora purpeofusca]
MTTTLVTGSRGKVGQGVIARLHAAGHSVRAASARPADLTVPDGVERTELALDRPEAFAAALRGVQQVFLYPQPAGINAFVEAAEAAGVEHVVLLSSSSVLGPDAENDPLAGHSLLVERALADSGLDCTFLRPDAFASNSLGWAYSIGRGLPIRLAHPDAHIAPIHPEDLSDIAAEALTGPLTGSAPTPTGPESLTFRDQLAVLAEVLGREIPVERISRAEAEEQMGRHMPAPVVTSLLDLWEAATHGPAPVHDTTLTLLGRPARSFHQWARENTAAFTRP